jgi:hypothetical protein
MVDETFIFLYDCLYFVVAISPYPHSKNSFSMTYNYISVNRFSARIQLH